MVAWPKVIPWGKKKDIRPTWRLVLLDLWGKVANVASRYFFGLITYLGFLVEISWVIWYIISFMLFSGVIEKVLAFLLGNHKLLQQLWAFDVVCFALNKLQPCQWKMLGVSGAKWSAQMCQTWNNRHSIVTTHRWNSCIILSRNPCSFHLFCLQLILKSLTFQCFEAHFQMFLWRCWCHVPPAALRPTLSAALCPSRRGLSWRRFGGIRDCTVWKPTDRQFLMKSVKTQYGGKWSYLVTPVSCGWIIVFLKC